jgi:DNA-binding NarL/FixJ family response regulator
LYDSTISYLSGFIARTSAVNHPEKEKTMAAIDGVFFRSTFFENSSTRSAVVHRVLLVDDRLPSRKGLRALLLTQPDIQVIGEAAGGEEALQLTRQLKPDVVVMDLNMPGMNGIEATGKIKEFRQRTRVVVLTLHNDRREEALDSGADGFLLKGCSPDKILRMIRNEKPGTTLKERMEKR